MNLPWKNYSLVACTFLFTALCAQQKGKPPCSSPVYRQFDFWIGEWAAYDTSGKKAGDSCIILEEWTSTVTNNGFHYAGKSYNTCNAAKQKWQQYWVDNAAGVTEYFNGHYEEGKMTVQTENEKQADGYFKILKMAFDEQEVQQKPFYFLVYESCCCF